MTARATAKATHAVRLHVAANTGSPAAHRAYTVAWHILSGRDNPVHALLWLYSHAAATANAMATRMAYGPGLKNVPVRA